MYFREGFSRRPVAEAHAAVSVGGPVPPPSLGRRDLFIRNLFASIAPRIDTLSFLFSFGICNRWRRRVVALAHVQPAERVLDVCTGTGNMVFLLAANTGRRGSVTGIDFCEEMVAIASDKARRWNRRHVGQVSFLCQDAKRLDFPDGAFDVVSVAFGMRNITDTARALREVHRVLKPNGRFVCLELTRPEPRGLLALYHFYLFRVIPFVARMVTKLDGPYRYLPKSIYGFYSVAEFKEVIEACGFSQVRVHPMTWGVATAYEARR